MLSIISRPQLFCAESHSACSHVPVVDFRQFDSPWIGQICLAVMLLCPSQYVEAQDWRLSGSLGLARSLQFDEGRGGLVFGIGVSRTWSGVRVGIEGQFIDFQDSRSVRRERTLFPSPQPATFTRERQRNEWQINVTAELPLHRSFSGTGSVGFYHLYALRAFEIRDSTGVGVLRPRDVSEGSSSGPGAAVGVLARIWEPIPGFTLGLDAKSHFALLHNSGNEGGFSFFHFFSGGLRVEVGL